jgi:hypothetical protein
MNRTLLIIATFFLSVTNSLAQTLFTYGSYSVDAKDFLRAYNKNNTCKNKTKSISDYLELFIKSRLKVQEAYERRYDTLPHLKLELANLRTQITENYLTDPDMTARMIKEAFQRSQKDVHAAHIFISLRGANGLLTALPLRKKEMTCCSAYRKERTSGKLPGKVLMIPAPGKTAATWVILLFSYYHMNLKRLFITPLLVNIQP